MSVQVPLPDDLAAEIDRIPADRAEFVAEAVRRALREESAVPTSEEAAKINAVAEELNGEAMDVLEFQTIP